MRKKAVHTIVEWAIAIILIVLFFSGGSSISGSSTPGKAHEISERSYHYGPSEAVREVPFGGNIIIYLGTYKKWFSADTVIKRPLGWFPYGEVGGIEIDKSKPLSYSWEISQVNKKLRLAKFFGYVTDPEISTVVLNTVISNGGNSESEEASSKSQTLKKDRMFLFTWNEGEQNSSWKSIQGLDRDGKLRYEEKRSQN